MTFPAVNSNHEPGAQPGNTDRRWLSVDDICADLGITRSTFDKSRAKGRGPRLKRLPNRNLLCRADWYATWLDGLDDDEHWAGDAA